MSHVFIPFHPTHPCRKEENRWTPTGESFEGEMWADRTR